MPTEEDETAVEPLIKMRAFPPNWSHMNERRLQLLSPPPEIYTHGPMTGRQYFGTWWFLAQFQIRFEI